MKHVITSLVRLGKQLSGWALLPLCALPVQAETTECGGYTVHHIAVNSTFIRPEIATQYNIVRAARSAFINISVLRKESDGGTTPVQARISGGRSNLMQQTQQIPFVEVREGPAIYYLGQFDFSNAELLRFRIEVEPEEQAPSCSLDWTTTLYAG